MNNVSLWGREPSLITGFGVAALNVLALVFHLDGELVAALNALLAAGVALLVRSQVAPVQALEALAEASTKKPRG